MRWELFCRVIDNHGDLGLCWRLACALADLGDAVRLWVDDPSALAWMAPMGHVGVAVRRWSDEAPPALGDVVVEAFGCDPPQAVVEAMVARRPPPVWINLEYLSAEPWVERSHGLPSPMRCGLTKWFYFPGFTSRTGGLLRPTDLPTRQAAFDGHAWLRERGWGARANERVVSLFCYPHAALADWLPLLASQPTLVLAARGPAAQQLAGARLPPELRLIELPWLTQQEYEHLLWSCDLNAVRGEDSFTQAHWARAPLLWHIYPQHDGAHAAKLEAWLDLAFEGEAAPLCTAVRSAMRRWNGLEAGGPTLPDATAWREAHLRWRDRLLARHDLATALRRFARGKQGPPC